MSSSARRERREAMPLPEIDLGRLLNMPHPAPGTSQDQVRNMLRDEFRRRHEIAEQNRRRTVAQEAGIGGETLAGRRNDGNAAPSEANGAAAVQRANPLAARGGSNDSNNIFKDIDEESRKRPAFGNNPAEESNAKRLAVESALKSTVSMKTPAHVQRGQSALVTPSLPEQVNRALVMHPTSTRDDEVVADTHLRCVCVPISPVEALSICTSEQNDGAVADIPPPSYLANYPMMPGRKDAKDGDTRNCTMCGMHCKFIWSKKSTNNQGNRVIQKYARYDICSICVNVPWTMVTQGIHIQWCNTCRKFQLLSSFWEGQKKGVLKRCGSCRKQASRRKHEAKAKRMKQATSAALGRIEGSGATENS